MDAGALNTDLVGWASAAVLLATIGQQVWKQWVTGATAGVSKWLFLGQMLSSLGFTVYSAMTGNVVFIAVNVALLLSALAGQAIFWRNRRRQRRRPAGAAPGKAAA